MGQSQDEAFHEIQLNGKQLVFLFMAATVVSVVIFLSGVLVGRGVRAERAAEGSAAATAVDPSPQPAPAAPPPTPAGSDPTTAAPPPAADDLTYFNRLEKKNVPAEQLKSGADKQNSAARTATPPAAPAEKATPKPSAPAAAETSGTAGPAGQGYAVQIAALNVRSEADAIAKRLTAKGYAAYVMAPPAGTPSVFRVRVGKFSTRREAESIAARLQKEEQFKPWVTR